MNKYIKSFNIINESIKRDGIILIKGKPKGKNKESLLFATHVNNWAELRPGAMMMFLSDVFYRIIKEGDKLKGVKINWRDEDSLKDALNFKSPGKISVVRNNNKTPYHWKTLNHTNLRDALDSIENNINRSDYILESINSSNSLTEIVVADSLKSIFMDGKNVMLLDWDISTDSLIDSITDYDEKFGNADWEASFDCIYVGRPELDKKLEEANLRRFEITIFFNSDFSYTNWYDSGDEFTPADGSTEIYDISTEITSIMINGEEFRESIDIDRIISKMDDAGLASFISNKHSKFI